MIGSEGAYAGVNATSTVEGAQFKEQTRLGRKSRGVMAVVCALALPGAGAAFAAAPKTTPSGLPVPRYVSLKFDEVNARAGPGDDSRLLWTYRIKGLPVQVVAENTEWRRICDPERGLAWVHKRTTDGRRSVLRTAAAALPMHAKAKADGRVIAFMASRSLGSLDRCAKGWCRISVGRAKGWVPATELWGTDEAPQCR